MLVSHNSNTNCLSALTNAMNVFSLSVVINKRKVEVDDVHNIAVVKGSANADIVIEPPHLPNVETATRDTSGYKNGRLSSLERATVTH